MNSKPLSYANLKIVIQYMNANQRFEIIQRMPALRKIEKLIPLKIETLEFTNPHQFSIDGTEYRLGTYRMYPGNDMPESHRSENSSGGVSYDLDLFGCPDITPDDVITPGDVVIATGNRYNRNRRFRFTDEESLNRFRNGQWAEAKRKNPNIPDMENAELSADIKWINLVTDATIRKNIIYYNTKLQPFKNRRENIPPRFTKWYQLTVTSPDNKKVQRMRRPGNIPMCEVEKNILNFFFGGRKNVPMVKHLNIEGPLVIRLPLNFQIRVEELENNSWSDQPLNALQDIIHPSSFPLKVFKTRTLYSRPYAHGWVISAQKLIIPAYATHRDYFLSRNFPPNRKVHIIAVNFKGWAFVDVVARWLRNPPIARFTFGIDSLEGVISVLRDLKDKFNGHGEIDTGCVRIPMNDHSEVRVSYEAAEDTRHGKWTMTIETVDV